MQWRGSCLGPGQGGGRWWGLSEEWKRRREEGEQPPLSMAPGGPGVAAVTEEVQVGGRQPESQAW